MPDPLDKAPGRLIGLIVAVVAGVTAIGFVTGTSSTEYRAARPAKRERLMTADVPPARSHAELERRPWSGGTEASGWPRATVIAAQAALANRSTAQAEAAPIGEALAARASLRAYAGAPPVIPHPVRAGGGAECMACHADGFVLGSRRAGAIPHDAFASCTQCHVAATGPFDGTAENAAFAVESSWRGLPAPTSGAVAYMGAPPAVPHPTRMRERCESCHGPDGRSALQTPHPERQSCLQCHPSTGGRTVRANR